MGKSFPNGVRALDEVDLTLKPGQIHALVGENGAGKSTLMSILAGLYRPDAGTITVDGVEREFAHPAQATACGIGMVHQEFKLFEDFTVAENVVYGLEPRFGRVGFDRVRASKAVAALAAAHGLAINPGERVRDLGIGDRQRVEILKVLHRAARLLILDEPTAVLAPLEVDALFAILRSLRDGGASIVIVTHKLREVMDFSDQVTVLRDGASVARVPTAETTSARLAALMTGRDIDLTGGYRSGTAGEVVLDVSNLSIDATVDGRRQLRDVSFSVRAGEIVGIAGVTGSGQRELLQAITGSLRPQRGSVALAGTDLGKLTVGQRRDAGIAYVPEDRRGVGAATTASVTDNLTIGYHRAAPILRGGLLRRRSIGDHARAIIDAFGIKVASAHVEAGTLSGGNLQKVVVGRELTHGHPLLIVDQPTRGVDIGAIENIHERIREYRDAGHAVLLVSAELSEIRALADRILVMYDGSIVLQATADEATETSIGAAMAGISAKSHEG